MKNFIGGVVALLAMGSFAIDAQEPKERILAGWPGLFPDGFNYGRHFEKPKVGKDSWQQSARYEWLGGRLETIQVTLLRSHAEARKIEFDDKNPRPENVKRIPLGDFAGFEFPDGKLVIDLNKHRLMIFEAPTWKFFRSDLAGFAKRFDLKACANAVDQPPRTDFRRRVELFRDLKKGMSLAQIREWVGDADKDIGSGIHIMQYRLDDGSQVLIGFPDFNKLIYVKHQDKAGKVVDLVK